MRFFPASYVLRKMQYQESVETLRYKHKYMNIAKDTEWLMENGLKFGGCREIARKYKEVFMEKVLRQHRACAIVTGLKKNLSSTMDKNF